MAVIEIHKAERANARLVIALASVSGDGKTYTAIQLAYGLANYRAEKVGFLDAENRRGSLYSDILQTSTRPTNDRFLIGDLHPPFSPQRYMDALDEFQKAGVEVLIIDSVTHEWEGTGGCGEIADAGGKIPNWNGAKREHKRFMNKLLQCDMHIIVCVRAREKTKPEKINGKLEFVEMGLTPIQEKNFMFEMTASLMMFEQGKKQGILKCPAALCNILGRREGYITADDGKALRDWVDGAVKLDPTVEKFRNRLLSNTEGGVAHIEECWKMTPEVVRKALGDAFHVTLVASAKGYDDLKALADKAAEEDAAAAASGQPVTTRAEPTAAERAAAEELAARARENAAKAPVTNGAQQTPAAQATTARGSLATPDDMATPAAAAPARREPQQQELQPAVKGVLASDPVF